MSELPPYRPPRNSAQSPYGVWNLRPFQPLLGPADDQRVRLEDRQDEPSPHRGFLARANHGSFLGDTLRRLPRPLW